MLILAVSCAFVMAICANVLRIQKDFVPQYDNVKDRILELYSNHDNELLVLPISAERVCQFWQTETIRDSERSATVRTGWLLQCAGCLSIPVWITYVLVVIYVSRSIAQNRSAMFSAAFVFFICGVLVGVKAFSSKRGQSLKNNVISV